MGLPLDKRIADSGWYIMKGEQKNTISCPTFNVEPTVVEPCSFVSIETKVTSTLTYNFSNTAATDIKYVLVESFESAECFWKILNSMSM